MQLIFTLLLLFVPVLLCGLLVFRFKVSDNGLKLILAFSASYLLALSFLHLLPEVFGKGDEHIGIFILIGFFIQLFLDFFSTGIEHGHIHVHHHTNKKFPLAILFGLYFHSFLEGLPISDIVQAQHQEHSILGFKNSLVVGLTLHNIPISVAFVTMLQQMHVSKKNSIIYLVLFAAMAPLGSCFSGLLHVLGISNIDYIIQISLGIVVGIFLHISTTIMFESSNNHKYNFVKMATIIAGSVVAYLIS
ncbi:MAG: zinc/iron permease [Bacteroidetes bacterium]|jgi:zinc transporter ZupT|nr:zinc/iron permease [Bacteroidota bacterium]